MFAWIHGCQQRSLFIAETGAFPFAETMSFIKSKRGNARMNTLNGSV